MVVHECPEHLGGYPPESFQVVALDAMAHGLTDALHGRQQGSVVLLRQPVIQRAFILPMEPVRKESEGFVKAGFTLDFEFWQFHVQER